MTDQPQLHSTIVAMISLASGIAAKHPDIGLCQLNRLRAMNIPDHQIQAVIEIARHIRDEASEKLDQIFDEKTDRTTQKTDPTPVSDTTIENGTGTCCTPTASGQSCC